MLTRITSRRGRPPSTPCLTCRQKELGGVCGPQRVGGGYTSSGRMGHGGK